MDRFVLRRLAGAVAFATWGFAAAATAAEADDVLKRAENFMAHQQPKSAYELLAPLEDERGGDPNYDYLLGLSALESGNAGRAAFAFERCLSVDPKNGPCRVQMARTHMALGENKSAYHELQTIKDYNPPPEVSRLVSTYLGTLSEREAAAHRQVTGFAQMGVGYDSNANSANNQSQIAVPALGGLVFTLSPNSLQRHDDFAQASAGVNSQFNLDSRWSLLADATGNARGYQELDQFDSRALDLGLGAGYKEGASQLTLKAQGQAYELDDNLYRRLWGALLQYQYTVSNTSQASLFAQDTRLDYRSQSARDAERRTYGGAYSTVLDMAYSPVVYAGAYVGKECPRNDAFRQLGQRFGGLRAGGTVFFTQNFQLVTSFSAERRVFNAVDPTFLHTRGDAQLDASLGLAYFVAPGLSLRPTYSFTRADSNIQIDDYTRHVVTFDIRYDM